MKKIIILTTVALICSSSINAQESNSKISRFYGFAAGGPAFFTGVSGNLGLSAIMNKKWIASIGRLNASRHASAPSDFMPTISTGWFLGAFDSYPIAETKFTYLSFGRYYPSSKTVSFILDGSIGVAKGQDFNYYNGGTPKNGEQTVYGVSANYLVTSTDRTALGLMGRAGMDWAFSGGAGMGLDFYYNYCGGGISDNVGFNLRLMIGYMPRSSKSSETKATNN
jgi:hypothetical protein